MMFSFYEFFAGGGMARTGLGPNWHCEFANDVSLKKAASYLRNFSGDHIFASCDINDLKLKDIPGKADLLWGSFPCQDLSLAGAGKGLNGSRSGLIWRLLNISKKLKKDGRGPKAIVLENVTGLLSSRNGQDFYDILEELCKQGFIFGTMMMDAIYFLPHSRPRIFLVAVNAEQVSINPRLFNGRLDQNYLWTSARLDLLWSQAPDSLLKNWVWWNVPSPPKRTTLIADILETNVDTWDSPAYTTKLLSLMAPLHLQKIEKAGAFGREVVGTLYRRTRAVDGIRAQRVEVRFDGISGCLRTPSGGSSRQRLLVVNGPSVRSRLMTTREAARLMGLPEDYQLPSSYNDAYQLAGDGVAVPVVNWLSRHLLLPMLENQWTIAAPQKIELLYA